MFPAAAAVKRALGSADLAKCHAIISISWPTLMEDHEGRPFSDAEGALRHARTMAAQFSESGILFGCTILVAKDDEVLFEVAVSRGTN
jgi:hypothetical protein